MLKVIEKIMTYILVISFVTVVHSFMQVMDLAEGHLAALQYVDRAAPGASTYSVFNLGSGHGYSVLEMLHAMNKACGESFFFGDCCYAVFFLRFSSQIRNFLATAFII